MGEGYGPQVADPVATLISCFFLRGRVAPLHTMEEGDFHGAQPVRGLNEGTSPETISAQGLRLEICHGSLSQAHKAKGRRTSQPSEKPTTHHWLGEKNQTSKPKPNHFIVYFLPENY